MRQVVEAREEIEVTLDEVSATKGYVMKGDKGDFITSKDTNGKFIWVRVTPGATAKPIHAYDTLKDAIKAKLEKGYEVFEYTDAELS